MRFAVAEFTRSMLDAIAGDEKFLLVLAGLILNFIALMAHGITGEQYVTLSSLTVGAYILGKATETVSTNIAQGKVGEAAAARLDPAGSRDVANKSVAAMPSSKPGGPTANTEPAK